MEDEMNGLSVGNEKGFTILEVVFAVSILAIGIMGYTALKTSNMYSWYFSKNLSLAVQLTDSNLEDLQMAGYNDTGWMDAGTHSQYSTNDFGDAPDQSAGDFTASGLKWTVKDKCPSELTKMVQYETHWNNDNNIVTITQVQVRP